MDELQKILISFGAIILIALLIYVGGIWYIRSLRKMNENKMLTMNLVIKYKRFLEYLDYQDNKKQNYYLFLVRINHLNLLENRYSDHVVKAYLTHIAKELSVLLPFGGKIAQTNQRDTFIMYYPALNEDPLVLGKQIKLIALKTYHENGIHIRKTNSVSVVHIKNLSGLSHALIHSVRNLGVATIFDDKKHIPSEEFMSLKEKIKESKLKLKSVNVETLKVNKAKEIYNDVLINDLKMVDFLNKLPLADQAWVNMYCVEHIVNSLYLSNIYANISLPVLLTTLEKELFVDYFETLVKSNQFLIENTCLSLKLGNVTYDEQVIKNILILSNLGVKISLDLDDINQNIYNQIQKYHIKRIEVSDQLMQHNLIAELLYFAKVNHIEVLYKTELKTLEEKNLNVTHITKEVIEFASDNQKRGRR